MDEIPAAIGDPPGGAGHVHGWVLLASHPVPVTFPFGAARTAVLARCSGCGLPEAWLLSGTWVVRGGEIGLPEDFGAATS